MPALPKLGILAGGGQAPFLVARAAQASGRPFFLFCLEGQADPALAAIGPSATLALGAVGKLRDLCRAEKIEEMVMIGAVRRPSLAELKPDFLGLKLVGKIGLASLGDDGLLRALGTALEETCGVRMIGAQEILADLLAPEGLLTRAAPDEIARADMAKGFDVAATLGALDIGQAVVVQSGIVLGVEAIEGTAALIERAGRLKREGAGGVLVKRAKPQQDTRFDLPAIGPDTVAQVQKAGLAGIALEAGRSLILGRPETIKAADEAGLFIVSEKV